MVPKRQMVLSVALGANSQVYMYGLTRLKGLESFSVIISMEINTKTPEYHEKEVKEVLSA